MLFLQPPELQTLTTLRSYFLQNKSLFSTCFLGIRWHVLLAYISSANSKHSILSYTLSTKSSQVLQIPRNLSIRKTTITKAKCKHEHVLCVRHILVLRLFGWPFLVKQWVSECLLLQTVTGGYVEQHYNKWKHLITNWLTTTYW